MKYTFKSGTTVEGSLSEILKVAKALGETVPDIKTYPSKTKGDLLISEMNTQHLQNAMIARARDFYTIDNFRSHSKAGINDFIAAFMRLSEDEIIVNLFTELTKRIK